MERPIEIPWQDLAEDTFLALVEEYVTRDGTDYGEQETAATKKVDQVVAGIKNKKFVIVYEQEAESVHIVTLPQWQEYGDS